MQESNERPPSGYKGDNLREKIVLDYNPKDKINTPESKLILITE